MSEANVKLVKRIYRAWEERSSIWRELIDPDIEYVNPDDAVEPGVVHGHESFSRWKGAYDSFRIEPRQFIDAGDEVVVIAAVRAEGRASGMTTRWDQGYVWTVRKGKATRFRWFNDPQKALAAAGVDPQARPPSEPG